MVITGGLKKKPTLALPKGNPPWPSQREGMRGIMVITWGWKGRKKLLLLYEKISIYRIGADTYVGSGADSDIA